MQNFKLNAIFVIRLLSVLSILTTTAPTFAQADNSACGPLGNTFGPFDYRTERGENLRLVEGAHFLPYIEALVRGKTNVTPGPDIDYTLRAFPNNHRALLAMMRLGEKENTPQPQGSRYSVECWFTRAIQFRPDDTTVRMIYSTYLSKNKRVPEAVAQLEYATTTAKDNPFTHNNIGLVYFDMKIYDKALTQAHRAWALGFVRTELRDQLEKVGKWQEPAAAPTEMPVGNSSEVTDAPAVDTPASAPK